MNNINGRKTPPARFYPCMISPFAGSSQIDFSIFKGEVTDLLYLYW